MAALHLTALWPNLPTLRAAPAHSKHEPERWTDTMCSCFRASCSRPLASSFERWQDSLRRPWLLKENPLLELKKGRRPWSVGSLAAADLSNDLLPTPATTDHLAASASQDLPLPEEALLLPGPLQQPVQDYSAKQLLSSVPSEELRGKTVIVRCDLTVDLKINQVGRRYFKDERKLHAVVPTITHLIRNRARVVILGHTGRMENNGRFRQMQMELIADRLARYLNCELKHIKACVGPEVEALVASLSDGEVVLLENVRLYKEDAANDVDFAKSLAKHVDYFVNDALAACHRAFASTTGVAGFVDRRLAGLHLEKELRYLYTDTHKPRRPFMAVLGGSRLSSQARLIRSLLHRCDYLLLGSTLSLTFLAALGRPVGNTAVEPEMYPEAIELLKLAHQHKVELVIPSDFVCGDSFSAEANSAVFRSTAIPPGWHAMDIGLDTVTRFQATLNTAQTVLWLGAMGIFQYSNFSRGTLAVAKMLGAATSRGATTIAGGKNVEEALRGQNCPVTWLTAGGVGALQVLEGGAMPGLDCLDNVPCDPPNWAAVFSDPGLPLTVDIGCGTGGFVLNMARDNKGTNYLGIEIDSKLVEDALEEAEASSLTNVHFMEANASTSLGSILRTYTGPVSFIAIQCPTPQFNERDRWKRIVQRPLVEAVLKYLAPGGKLFCQSDVEEVARDMVSMFDVHLGSRLVRAPEHEDPANLLAGLWLKQNPTGCETEWEKYTQSLGRTMHRVLYLRTDLK